MTRSSYKVMQFHSQGVYHFMFMLAVVEVNPKLLTQDQMSYLHV